jgi:C4-dicarboxylate-specific signal transduction histidine kinase
MNLLTNARDALNEKHSGYNENKIIRLNCSHFVKEKRKGIRIIVEDHDNGIPKNIQAKIFNPFFTTKERDKGTGLGLSIGHGIVKDHNGELTFKQKKVYI